MKKIISKVMFSLFIVGMLTFTLEIKTVKSKPKTIIVPDEHQTIQEAIDAAEAGDIILVKTGLYHEHLRVNKPLTLTGEDPKATIISGDGSGEVIFISANNVKISNFRITDADFGIHFNQSNYCNISNNIIDSIWWHWGLYLYQSNHNIISNNTFQETHIAIYMDSSNNNTIIRNKIYLQRVAIFIANASHNRLMNNSLEQSEEFGVYMLHSTGNIFRSTTIKNSSWNFAVLGSNLLEFIHDIDTSVTVDGKLMYYWVNQHDKQVPSDAGYVAAINCSNIVIRDLSLKNCGQAVLLVRTDNSLVENVSVSNSWYGIFAFQSNNNAFSKNIIKKSEDFNIFLNCSNHNVIHVNILENCNRFGLFIGHSNNNVVKENTLKYNQIGLGLHDSVNNTFCRNNFIYNNIQISTQTSPCNKWDDGYSSGGNYWSDYTGVDLYSGPYQNETGSDGIADYPYFIDDGNQDNYPLMGMFYDFEVVGLDGEIYRVEVISNSTVSELSLVVWLGSSNKYLQSGQEFVLFYVEGENDTSGFCRITIPRALLNDSYLVLVDWTIVPAYQLNVSNSTHAYLYFTYNHTKHEVMIIPEFQSTTILLILLISSIITTIIWKIKKRERLKSHWVYTL